MSAQSNQAGLQQQKWKYSPFCCEQRFPINFVFTNGESSHALIEPLEAHWFMAWIMDKLYNGICIWNTEYLFQRFGHSFKNKDIGHYCLYLIKVSPSPSLPLHFKSSFLWLWVCSWINWIITVSFFLIGVLEEMCAVEWTSGLPAASSSTVALHGLCHHLFLYFINAFPGSAHPGEIVRSTSIPASLIDVF